MARRGRAGDVLYHRRRQRTVTTKTNPDTPLSAEIGATAATKTWEGEWKPTLPPTTRQIDRARMFGIADLPIDGIEVRCTIVSLRGTTFGVTTDDRWYQLVRPATQTQTTDTAARRPCAVRQD